MRKEDIIADARNRTLAVLEKAKAKEVSEHNKVNEMIGKHGFYFSVANNNKRQIDEVQKDITRVKEMVSKIDLCNKKKLLDQMLNKISNFEIKYT